MLALLLIGVAYSARAVSPRPPPPPLPIGPDRPGEPIFFDRGQVQLTTDASSALASAAKFITEFGLVLMIEGHADEAVSRDQNLALGLRRAIAISDHLKELGVPPEQMHIVSYGSDPPIDGSTSDEKLNQAVLLVTRYKFDD